MLAVPAHGDGSAALVSEQTGAESTTESNANAGEPGGSSSADDSIRDG